MFVAASTRCFPNLPLDLCLEKLADLEYTAVEVVIGTKPGDLNPDFMEADPVRAVRLIQSCRQVTPVAFFFDIAPDDPRYFEKFVQCVKLAKAVRIITIVVLSSPLGTPYNEEIERLRRMCQLGIVNGITISVLTQKDCITDSIDSIHSLCRSIPELSIALDPSWFIFDRPKPIDFDSITGYVSHVRLRDTTQTNFQVQLGQGVLEYNKLIIQLNQMKYDHALCVDLAPLSRIDQESEMRKMRMLVESIL